MSDRAVQDLSVDESGDLLNPDVQIIPFTVEEQTEKDAPLTQVQLDAIKQAIAYEVMEIVGPIRAVALTFLSEVNILRLELGLAPRTVQQLKDSVFGNGE